MRNTITQKHKTGNSLLPEDLKTYYENILASIQDGVIVVSNECVIITFNPAIEEMSGISSSYARGQSLQSVFSDEPRL
ncbi:MAG: PAS domain S-box protein, partial [Nitrospinota bacterium]